MISEERVREEFKLAVADQEYAKDMERAGSFFKMDYVGKELMISFISGTACFLIFIVLWVMASMESLASQLQSMDYVSLGVTIAIGYLIFILIYMFITALIYILRYNRMHRLSIAYRARIRKLNKIYDDEEAQ